MEQDKLEKLEKSIQNMKDKKSRIYLLVQDTKGNAKASVSYIYNLAMALKQAGYNPIMLHEKSDYTGVSSWLSDEPMKILPHKAIEDENLEVAPEDFIVIPELYGFVMSQISKLPCGKIVLSQAYDHVLETLQPGQTWSQLGFLKCITTSETQKEYLEGIMKNVSYDILKPFISDSFIKNELPSKPIIAVHSREQRDSVNMIKSFYIKFPQYRWITFRDMRGLSQSEFANTLKDCCLSVWIDETSSYGTFPIESMKCGVPVLGLVPNILPEWMNEDNGIWVNNKTHIVDYVADYIQNWLEDNLNPNLFESMIKTTENLSNKEEFYSTSVNLFQGYINKRMSSFEEQLSKLQTIEE
jgi:glycosyltransferase involved in cell wall biosynthesis